MEPFRLHWSVADLRGRRGRAPPGGSKFFQFHAVFGKFQQNHMLAPPRGVGAPPPRGNPGSATADSHAFPARQIATVLTRELPTFPWGVLDLLNCVQIRARLGCFSHSITMEALKPARYKTAKIYRIEHTPARYDARKQAFVFDQ